MQFSNNMIFIMIQSSQYMYDIYLDTYIIIGRTYGIVVFDNEPLESGVTQLHEKIAHVQEKHFITTPLFVLNLRIAAQCVDFHPIALIKTGK